MKISVKQTFIYLSLGLAAVGCGESQGPSSQGSAISHADASTEEGAGNGGTSAADSGKDGASGQTSNQTLSDSQILAVLGALNAAEIEQNSYAALNTITPDVLYLAKVLVEAHTEAVLSLGEVASDQHIQPRQSDISQKLRASSRKTVEQLKAAHILEFDTLYVQSQIKIHSQAIEILDEEVLPAVRNPALRTEAENTRASVEAHLNLARDVAAELDLDVDAGVPLDAGL